MDLHLIGHSRGAVVISQALGDLVGTTDPVLAGGYKLMTVLDPHPGNNTFFQPGYSQGPGLLAAAAAATLIAGESATQDPQVVIPSNVDAAQVTSSTLRQPFLGTSSLESYLNPWGEDPSLLINQSGASVASVDLTSQVDSVLGPIGHVEVPVWYDQHVVQQDAVFAPYRA